jgi:hypothetical protein
MINIPKIIHYCWSGRGEKPASVLKYIESWRKYCPDYEIKEWNEDNFDINQYKYTAEAYANRKWAFITDVVRLYAIYTEGGVYMDTDVETIGNYDKFLHHHAFSGFETDGNVPTGMMAAEKGSLWAKELLDDYIHRSFVKEDGTLDMTTNTTTITNYMLSKGLVLNNTYQEFDGLCAMYPADYFCPKDHRTGEIILSKNTVCIHHFAGSWMEHKSTEYKLYKLKIKLMQIFGVQRINKLISILHLKSIKNRLFK